MSVFQTVLDLTHSERELVLFDNAFREIQTQLRMLEGRPDGLEGVKDLLNNKSYDKLEQLSKDRGTSLSVLLKSYNLENGIDD